MEELLFGRGKDQPALAPAPRSNDPPEYCAESATPTISSCHHLKLKDKSLNNAEDSPMCVYPKLMERLVFSLVYKPYITLKASAWLKYDRPVWMNCFICEA